MAHFLLISRSSIRDIFSSSTLTQAYAHGFHHRTVGGPTLNKNHLSGSRLRIALISPRGPLYRHRTGIWKKSMRYMPLTLTTLASLVPPELNAEVALVDEGV